MIIKAVDAVKTYPRKNGEANFFYAVQKTSLTIEKGEFTAILGRSGSGKSTLLNMLCGLLSPTEGQILYDDTDLYKMNDAELSLFRNKHIGVIPQVQSVLPNLTVYENITLPCFIDNNKADCYNYAEELLKLMDITHLKDVYASDLSGGEMRRTAIARALIQKPDVIFADEPTADLDDENTVNILKLFKNISESGTAVFIVTHESDTIKYADRVYRMDNGIIKSKS